MAKIQQQHQSVTGITSANDTTSYILCDVAAAITVQGVNTVAGAPSAATLQTTVDPFELITAGTATWVSDSIVNSASFIYRTDGPITGLRLDVAASGGTWTLNARQAYDSTILN